MKGRWFAKGVRLRFAAGLQPPIYVLWYTVVVVVAILVGGLAGPLIRWLMGEYVAFGSSALTAVKLAALFGLCGLTASVTVGLAAQLVPSTNLAWPWLVGFAASVGLWGSMALVRPSGITSGGDIKALAAVTGICGAVFGFLIWRTKDKAEEDGP